MPTCWKKSSLSTTLFRCLHYKTVLVPTRKPSGTIHFRSVKMGEDGSSQSYPNWEVSQRSHQKIPKLSKLGSSPEKPPKNPKAIQIGKFPREATKKSQSYPDWENSSKLIKASGKIPSMATFESATRRINHHRRSHWKVVMICPVLRGAKCAIWIGNSHTQRSSPD